MVKPGGLALPVFGFESFRSIAHFTSEQLATEWKTCIESCIDASALTAACSNAIFRRLL
jgi:hypothetical protein